MFSNTNKNTSLWSWSWTCQVGLTEILVEFVEVVHGEADAEHVDEDPQHVQHIVPEWSLKERNEWIIEDKKTDPICIISCSMEQVQDQSYK